MVEELQKLLDKQSIYEVLVRYCSGADRCGTIIRSVYHADTYDDHGYWRGSGHGFAAFLPNRLTNANSATIHSISNALINVDEDTARSESRVVATLFRRNTALTLVDVWEHDILISNRGGMKSGESMNALWSSIGTGSIPGRLATVQFHSMGLRVAPDAQPIQSLY